MTPEDLTSHDGLKIVLNSQASSLSRRYRKWVEIDDVRQELWMNVLRKADLFIEFLDRDPEDKVEISKGLAAANTTLWRYGDKYCRKEKAAKSGYRPSDEAFYDRTRIAALMDMRFNGTSGTNLVDDSQPKGKTRPGSGYTLETQFADIDHALEALDPVQRTVVLRAFVDQNTEAEIAEIMSEATGQEFSRSRVHRTVDRACRVMIDALGGDSPY